MEERRRNRELPDEGISINIPGALAGRAFDPVSVFSLLVDTVRKNVDAIDLALHRLHVLAEFSGRAERLRAILEWSQIEWIIGEKGGTGAEVLRPGRVTFESVLPGLASTISFSTRDIVELICSFLHQHQQFLSGEIIQKGTASDADVALAEALVIAETVQHYLGFATQMDDVPGDYTQPTLLQLQAWDVTARALGGEAWTGRWPKECLKKIKRQSLTREERLAA